MRRYETKCNSSIEAVVVEGDGWVIERTRDAQLHSEVVAILNETPQSNTAQSDPDIFIQTIPK